ncbi:MAG: hypothetical protein ACTTKI_07940 [Tannerella sp.]|uniref:hypothetical protein n=1 Tax=Tannerella sp. TaxID=2382127 RepID=UPI003FA2C434
MKRMQKTWLKQHRGIGAQNFLFVSLLMHASIRKTINSYTDIFCPPLIATNIVYPGQTSPHVGYGFPYMGHRFPYVGYGSPHVGHRFPYVGYGFPHVGHRFPYVGHGFPHVGHRFPYVGHRFPYVGHRFPYVGYGFPYVEKHSVLRKTDFVRNQSALKHDIVNLIY